LVRGASDAQKDFQRGGKLSSFAKRYALSRNLLYDKGYDVEVMAFFEPSLEPLGKWWRQLFGESEGKGQRGIFPTVCLYTEELHSLGQYMQEGKRHVQETFFHVKKPLVDPPIPTTANTSAKERMSSAISSTFFSVSSPAQRETLSQPRLP
jgi:glucose-6-phosphate isomerase